MLRGPIWYDHSPVSLKLNSAGTMALRDESSLRQSARRRSSTAKQSIGWRKSPTNSTRPERKENLEQQHRGKSRRHHRREQRTGRGYRPASLSARRNRHTRSAARRADTVVG